MYVSASSGSSTVLMVVLPLLLALIGAIVIYVMVMPKKKDGNLGNPFLQWVHDFFHFKKLYIESILRFCFCFFTLYIILMGFFSLFVAEDPLSSFLIMILGPIVVRLFYEMVLMALIAIRNIIEINNKLPDFKNEQKSAPTVEAPAAPAAPATCPNCGAIRTEGTNFCVVCGTKLN